MLAILSPTFQLDSNSKLVIFGYWLLAIGYWLFGGIRRRVPGDMVNIREARIEDVDVLAEVIRSANQVVADQLGLNTENAPTHPSHCQPDWIQHDFDKSVFCFILEVDGNPIGCVALEQAVEGVCYLELWPCIPIIKSKAMASNWSNSFVKNQNPSETGKWALQLSRNMRF